MSWPPPASQHLGGVTSDCRETQEDERQLDTAAPRLPAVTFLLVGVLSVLEMLGCQLAALADEPEDARVSVRLPRGARLSVEGHFVLNAALTPQPSGDLPRQAADEPAAPPAPSLDSGRRSRSPGRLRRAKPFEIASIPPAVPIEALARSRRLSSDATL